MAKRKIIRKSNRPLTLNSPNYYSWGGDFKAALGDVEPLDFKSTFSGGNVAGMLKGGLAAGLGSTIGKFAGNAISGGLESGAGKAISNIGGTIGGAVSAVNPILGGIISVGSGVLGGATNALFGSKLNQEKINEIEGTNKVMNALMVDSSSADNIESQWASQDFGSDFSRSDIGKDGLFSNKAKNKFKSLKKQQDIARNRALSAFEGAADAADIQSDLNAMSNFAAFGGPLDVWGYGNGAIGYELAKENLGIKAMDALSKNKITSLPNSFTELNTFADGGSIHIKPSKRGTFTAAAKKHGKGVQEFARQVLANKENYSPAMVKKANFARNAASWKHSDGGPLMSNGAVWDNGLTYIGNGGTHEENPMEGVPMGVDNQGTPNLVEQGEVVFNDYVFSNRLAVPDAIRSKYKLRGNKEMTFADAAKKMAKESEERPNDPISKRGLMDSMSKLQQAQEMVRQSMAGQEEKRKYGKKYDIGGLLSPYYDAPEGTMYDPLSDRSVYVGGLFDNDNTTSINFGAGIMPSGEWVEEPKYMARAAAKRAGYDVGSSSEEYNENPVAIKEADSKKSNLSWLRYAPVVGSALGVAQNLFSKPDYSNANAILEAANDAGNYSIIGYTPIGNYLQYRPLDRNYYINKLGAQAGATRRAIMNTTSPSRNAALLAADYNAQGRLGDLMRQAEEYDLAQRQAVETFNRGTNISNAEMGLKAAMANQEAQLKARSSRLSGVAQAMSMRDAIAARRNASLSSNLSNLFESLGNIGIDEYNREDRDKLIRAGVFGTLSEKPQGWSNKRWEDYKKAVSGTGYRNGGKLKKKRGGFTY